MNNPRPLSLDDWILLKCMYSKAFICLRYVNSPNLNLAKISVGQNAAVLNFLG